MNYKNITHKNITHTRIRDLESKMRRIINGELKVRYPEEIKTALGIMILQCETEIFNLSLQ